MDSSKTEGSGSKRIAISLAVLVLGIVIAVALFPGGPPRPSDDAQSVRDGEPVEIATEGSHSIYVRRGASKRLDSTVNEAFANASKAKIEVRDESGAELEVRRAYEATELKSTKLARLVDFDVPSPGRYTISFEPSLEKIGPSVQPTIPVEEIKGAIMGWFIQLVVSIGIGVLAVIAAGMTFKRLGPRPVRPAENSLT